jgi:hypothetical protein
MKKDGQVDGVKSLKASADGDNIVFECVDGNKFTGPQSGKNFFP